MGHWGMMRPSRGNTARGGGKQEKTHARQLRAPVIAAATTSSSRVLAVVLEAAMRAATAEPGTRSLQDVCLTANNESIVL